MLGRLTLRARAIALFPLAALALHDGFYRLGLGPAHASGNGHGYLTLAEPLAGTLGALVLAGLVTRLVAAWRVGEAGEPGASWLRLWVVASAGLLVLFGAQESLEAAFGGGHPVLLEPGGWPAPLLAVAVGGLLTLVLRGARAAVVAIARRSPRRRANLRRAPAPRRRLPRSERRRTAPLALSAAGRAPPRRVAVTH
jgi:hypothetical protein